MHLKELTITGFKSFAKKSDFEFSAPITAIVGPNGSGKSNVAEAFRFVLGEQSVKSMRGKRGEDLIWDGSEKVSRANRAAVRIVLNNQARVFPLDFDELEVERIVHRDGQNEYRINGSKVRLKDVQELLAAANIGPTGHHIISQGEADRILSASPKERREMIEDALGLKVFQFKKQEAERKLARTSENIQSVQVLRREVAPHLKYLEKQVKKIEKSLELQEELKEVYREYLRREDTFIAVHHDRLTNERAVPASRLVALEEQLAEAKRRLSETSEDSRKDELLSCEEALRKATNDRQGVLKQLGQIEGQVEYISRRLREAETKAKTAVAAPIDYERIVSVVEVVERDISKALSQKSVETLSRALEGVVHTLRSFLKKHSESDSDDEHEDERNELKKLQAELTTLQERHTEAVKNEEVAQGAYHKLQSSIESELHESRELERAVFELVNEKREIENKLERIDRELGVLERDRSEFKRELQEAVTLIGRSASDYFSHQIVKNGETITNEMIAEEPRDVQRERRHQLEKMKIRLEELGIGATDEVMKEYNDTKERDAFLEREIADLEASVEKLQSLIGELNNQLDQQFTGGIDKITAEFNRFFVLMFGGGQAALSKVAVKKRRLEIDEETGEPLEADDDDEPVEEGIELSVSLPNKRVKGLDMLSGGERALTSIALIFAMSQVNPPLFVILDETDAALDEANSRRYGDMIEALAKQSQLILITHNRETMSRAGILYGITMGSDGISKVLSVKFEEAAVNAK